MQFVVLPACRLALTACRLQLAACRITALPLADFATGYTSLTALLVAICRLPHYCLLLAHYSLLLVDLPLTALHCHLVSCSFLLAALLIVVCRLVMYCHAALRFVICRHDVGCLLPCHLRSFRHAPCCWPLCVCHLSYCCVAVYGLVACWCLTPCCLFICGLAALPLPAFSLAALPLTVWRLQLAVLPLSMAACRFDSFHLSCGLQRCATRLAAWCLAAHCLSLALLFIALLPSTLSLATLPFAAYNWSFAAPVSLAASPLVASRTRQGAIN